MSTKVNWSDISIIDAFRKQKGKCLPDLYHLPALPSTVQRQSLARLGRWRGGQTQTPWYGPCSTPPKVINLSVTLHEMDGKKRCLLLVLQHDNKTYALSVIVSKMNPSETSPAKRNRKMFPNSSLLLSWPFPAWPKSLALRRLLKRSLLSCCSSSEGFTRALIISVICDCKMMTNKKISERQILNEKGEKCAPRTHQNLFSSLSPSSGAQASCHLRRASGGGGHGT